MMNSTTTGVEIEAVWMVQEGVPPIHGTLICAHDKSPYISLAIANVPFNYSLPRVLKGISNDGRPVTVIGTNSFSRTGNGVWTKVEATALRALVGVDLDSLKDFEVNELVFSFQHLREWIGGNSFEWSNEPSAISIKLSLSGDQSWEIDDDLRMELNFNYSAKDCLFEKRLSHDYRIRFIARSGFNSQDLSEMLEAVRMLLHFAILRPVKPRSIGAVKNENAPSKTGKPTRTSIHIFGNFLGPECSSEIHPDRWAFMFKDVSSDFGKFFGKWIRICKKNNESLECYSTTIYHDLPPPIVHLCLTQALESFFVKNGGDEKLKFVDKISTLVTRHRQLFRDVVDISEFSKIVRDNRNWHTHHNLPNKDKILELPDLFLLNEKLERLYRVCIFSEMGLPPSRFYHALRRDDATVTICP